MISYITDLSKDEYDGLKKLNLLTKFFITATGDFEKDCLNPVLTIGEMHMFDLMQEFCDTLNNEDNYSDVCSERAEFKYFILDFKRFIVARKKETTI